MKYFIIGGAVFGVWYLFFRGDGGAAVPLQASPDPVRQPGSITSVPDRVASARRVALTIATSSSHAATVRKAGHAGQSAILGALPKPMALAVTKRGVGHSAPRFGGKGMGTTFGGKRIGGAVRGAA